MNNITLIHGDCLEEMRKMKDKSVDLCLTDPPYGIGNNITYRKNQCSKRAKSKDYGQYDWNNAIPSKEIFTEIFRVSKNQIIWGGNYFLDYGIFRATPAWLVWDKKNDTSTFAKCELAWTSYKHAIKIYRYLWNGMLQEKMGRDKEERYHPTQKPVFLMKRCIVEYTEKDHIIFDPFMGSGTAGIACKEFDRKFIGIEIDKGYYEIAKKRIFNTQKSMF